MPEEDVRKMYHNTLKLEFDSLKPETVDRLAALVYEAANQIGDCANMGVSGVKVSTEILRYKAPERKNDVRTQT